ncbi:MAG: amidohydrolase [Planctomycetaceae bacterium]|nr:amidohydrolase [Planctomycetaceae bacterium]
MSQASDPAELMRLIDAQLAHIWMVRTFLKHSEEAEEDEELMLVVRELYDYCHALGASFAAGNAADYLKMATKKLSKLKAATVEMAEILPRISVHTNFKMAQTSLETAVAEITRLLNSAAQT